MSNDVYVTVAGWVAKKPEIRVTADKTEWTSVRVASTPRRRTADGRWTDGKTEWFEVKAWGELAQNVALSVDRGHPVVVTGRLTTDEWQTTEGADRKNLVIHAQAMGHDLARGRTTFVRVRHESGADGAVTDVSSAVELPDSPPSAPSPEDLDPEGATSQDATAPDAELEPAF